MKKVVIVFNFPNVSLQTYDSMWEDIRAEGQGNPKGLISHVGAATEDNGLFVVDVWESKEAFDAFGATLMPLLAKHNVPMVQPQMLSAHYYYQSQAQEALA